MALYSILDSNDLHSSRYGCRTKYCPWRNNEINSSSAMSWPCKVSFQKIIWFLRITLREVWSGNHNSLIWIQVCSRKYCPWRNNETNYCSALGWPCKVSFQKMVWILRITLREVWSGNQNSLIWIQVCSTKYCPWRNNETNSSSALGWPRKLSFQKIVRNLRITLREVWSGYGNSSIF